MPLLDRWYAGIGSRETPSNVLLQLPVIARFLAAEGWGLRSGGARGADTAFEVGAPPTQREIYLPTRPKFVSASTGIAGDQLPTAAAARTIAMGLHPAWDRLDAYAQLLMTRNVFQVLGATLEEPVRFILCWAKRPQFRGDRIVNVAGGTGLAVRLAAEHNIPVFDLAHPPHAARIDAWLKRDARLTPILVEDQEPSPDLFSP